MVRVVVIDRHPAMRAGIEAILHAVADIHVVAAASARDRNDIDHALYRTAPDVVLLEDAPGRADGVELARELKSCGSGPRVLLLADRPDATQVATAILADADGVVDSAAQPRELIEAVQTVATGGLAFPDLDRRALAEVAQHLPVEDHAILAMRLAATPRRDLRHAAHRRWRVAKASHGDDRAAADRHHRRPVRPGAASTRLAGAWSSELTRTSARSATGLRSQPFLIPILHVRGDLTPVLEPSARRRGNRSRT